jgi:hypothetical protein
VNKQGERSMKIAIKMFPRFGWIETLRSKIAKIRVFRVDYFNLSLFWVPKLRSVAQNEWKKHPYICIFLFLVQKQV